MTSRLIILVKLLLLVSLIVNVATKLFSNNHDLYSIRKEFYGIYATNRGSLNRQTYNYKDQLERNRDESRFLSFLHHHPHNCIRKLQLDYRYHIKESFFIRFPAFQFDITSLNSPKSSGNSLHDYNSKNLAQNRIIYDHHTILKMIWCYPIFGDDPKKLRRKKISPIWELGDSSPTTSLRFETANAYAQNIQFIPTVGRLVAFRENGLGKTTDTLITAENAAGGSFIDAQELKRIEDILPTFDQRNGLGIAQLIGAKRNCFAFKYTGPLTHKSGVKNWLKYMISYRCPNSRVFLISEKWFDEGQYSDISRNRVPLSLSSKVRRSILCRHNYTFENDLEDNGPNTLGFTPDNQML